MEEGDRDRHDREGPRLVGRAQRDGHVHQQRGHAQRSLRGGPDEGGPHQDALRSRQTGAAERRPQGTRAAQRRHGESAVVELDVRRVLEEVADAQLRIPVLLRDQPPLHQRKGVVREARLVSGHVGA